MYHYIIVAVDGSETSNKALDTAIKLAQDQKAKLSLLHVIDISVPATEDAGETWIDVNQYQTTLIEAGHHLLKTMEKEAISYDVNVDSRLIEITDNSGIAETINTTIDSLKPDLLVLGTHGRRGFKRFLLGSVAEEILRMVNVPVLLIRAPEGK